MAPAFFRAAVSRLVALALPLLVAAPLAAQQSGFLAGKVTDKGTGEPIGNARVAVVSSLTGGTTRSDGTFRIAVPAGTTEFRVTAIGYTATRFTATIPAGGTATQDVSLERAITSLEEVATTGTRAVERSVTQSPVPVDVISAEVLRSTGRVETAQALQFTAPSVNFPRPTVADGTDHVRPVTLRGLAPDQVLVLVNGKRRHTSALINVNGTVGRGSGMVDLNAIPSSAIERIEVLRDGAAAQYGSDAIAGVVNIILKENAANDLTVQAGQTAREDGEVVLGAATYSPRIRDGFLTLSAEFRARGYTNRSEADRRAPFRFNDSRNLVNGQTITAASLLGPQSFRQGDADTRDGALFFNFGKTINAKADFYAFGGFSYRRGEAAANYRLPSNTGSVLSIFPNGFLPFILSDVYDLSSSVGVRGAAGKWNYDVSAVFGGNSFAFNQRNTVNASLGSASPTRFYNGTLIFNQLTVNSDIRRPFDIGGAGPLNVAFGAEFRVDRYAIRDGDRESWVQGPVTQRQNYTLPGQPASNNNLAPTSLAPAGSQGFPGFRPSDEVDVTRRSVSGYLDVEFTPIKQLLIGAAGRAEHFSDFGSQVTGKGTARLEVVKGVAFRGAISTGFKAPSLGQQWFSATATNLIGGQLLDVRTFPVGSSVARALGAQPLKPETSVNYSGGVVFTPVKNLQITADAYQINIDDRIVLSSNFIDAAANGPIGSFLTQQGLSGLAGGRFFTNAVDTRTLGLDIVANYGLNLSPTTTVSFLVGYNLSRHRVLRASNAPPQLAALTSTPLFDRVERTRLELGQPRDNLLLATNFQWRRLTLNLRTQRFGAVTLAQLAGNSNNNTASGTAGSVSFAANTLDQTYQPKFVTDVSASYRVGRLFTVTLGVDNLFNVYPDRNRFNGLVDPVTAGTGVTVTGANPYPGSPFATFGGNSNFGIFPFSGQMPFGANGAFYYSRITVGF